MPRQRTLGAAGLMGLAALALSGCATPQAAARTALTQFLRDVGAHQSAYAYGLLTPAAAERTPYDAFNRAVLSSRARFTVVQVRRSTAGRTRAVVLAQYPGGASRRVRLTVDEVGTAGDWMVGAPFTTGGAAAAEVLGSALACPGASLTGYAPRSLVAACTAATG